MADDFTDGDILDTGLGRVPLQVAAGEEPGELVLNAVGSGSVPIVEADVPVCGGVVHVIGGVLLPVDGDGEIDEKPQQELYQAAGFEVAPRPGVPAAPAAAEAAATPAPPS